MTVSTIAGATAGGVMLPCILYEGVATVTANVMGPDGYYDKGISFASPLVKDQWVTLDVQTENTYAATKGLPVVKAIAAGSLVLGQIVSEPTIKVAPATTPTSTWAAHLTGGFYRIATVWFPCVTAVTKATHVNAATAAVVPGIQATIQAGAAATTAAGVAGSPETLVTIDVASGGVGGFSFHYVPSSAATVSILYGFTGGVNLIAS